MLHNSVVVVARTCTPTSNAASHDNHEKINSWVSFSFLYEYGAPLGGPAVSAMTCPPIPVKKIPTYGTVQQHLTLHDWSREEP